MLTCSRVAAGVVLCAVVAAPPAMAQDEAALKSYFEGHRVTVRIDMPGTQEGVDVHVDSAHPLDFSDYRDDLKKYGVALHAGQSATVTLVKVKKDLIEFQLDGGGFGTLGDDTSTSVYLPEREKSEREKELERRIRNEDDRERRHRMERELEELREARERENRRIRVERERLEEQKVERIAERRLRGGSRFNLRYDDRVPPGMRPQDVMAALADYVDFGAPAITMAPSGARLPDLTALRKGMAREEVERMLGRPAESSQRRTGDVAMTTLVFVVNDQRISADFVEDVLVRYTITSK
ncbi:MAG TPA: hypothetical protein VFA59_21485 [Vicinamibacterales bacterium]|nr:hypothetical protein [Vicinamibacterales bacterium]